MVISGLSGFDLWIFYRKQSITMVEPFSRYCVSCMCIVHRFDSEPVLEV